MIEIRRTNLGQKPESVATLKRNSLKETGQEECGHGKGEDKSIVGT